MSQPLIIVGAGLAGWTTAREFRKLDTTTPVLLVTADSGDFYAKPSLSNAFAQGRLPAQLISTPAAKMAETLNVTLLAQSRVEAIDTATQTLSVRSAGGLQTLAFSSLVLATGAQPIRVPVQGDAADAVVSINSLDDFAAFHARLQAVAGAPGAPQRQVLIMGAGLIGCEFANDLAQAGVRVRVVDPGPRALAALLPPEASSALQEALELLGVHFDFGCTVRAVDHAEGRLQVTLATGEVVAADAVLSAVGLRADTALAQAAGLQVDRAIVVNTQLQTSAAHVYALGDSAQYASAPSLLSAHGSTLPYVMPIMSAARALAATLAGTPTALAFALMPVSVKTPALPLVVAAAQAGLAGNWTAASDGIWHWLDDAGQPRGFVLAGAQTAQRMAQAKLLTA
ncbi:MAG: FAD-dependent oxidoreductase [Polaromonas sp.]|nr:FAD-dependent oxidoreductase [Polaromonas sp.]